MSEENLDLVNAPAAENQADVSGTNETSQPVEATETEAQQPAVESEAPKEDKGLPKGIERRFAKMSKRHHEDQARLAEMEAKLAELTAQPEKSREEYSDDEWIERVATQKAEQLFEQKQNEARTQAEQQQAAQEKAQAWQTKIDSFTEELPNYAETLAEADLQIPVDSLDQIIASPVGPKMAYHLAQNPDQAERLGTMSEVQRGIALAKLEMTLENAPKAAAPLTKAAPTPKAGGAGSSAYNPLGDQASTDDWIVARRKQLYGN